MLIGCLRQGSLGGDGFLVGGHSGSVEHGVVRTGVDHLIPIPKTSLVSALDKRKDRFPPTVCLL